jgi:hypothetical protein
MGSGRIRSGTGRGRKHAKTNIQASLRLIEAKHNTLTHMTLRRYTKTKLIVLTEEDHKTVGRKEGR